jgi:hypothetical protein
MQSNLAYALEVEDEASTAPDGGQTAPLAQTAPLLLHVRFRPDTSVLKIDYCPSDLSPEEWFKRLCARAGDKFAARAGGRGFFRLTPAELEALSAPRAH